MIYFYFIYEEKCHQKINELKIERRIKDFLQVNVNLDNIKRHLTAQQK